VTDSLTGLEWTKDANAGGYKTLQGALDYVKTVNTGGHSDWRLPNERELRSLVDYSKALPALPQGHPFTNVCQDYWSSTSLTSISLAADLGVGWFNDSYNFNYYGVWPVRLGQVGILIISSTTTISGSTTTSIISSTTTTTGGGSTTTTTTGDASTTTTISSGSTTTSIGATTTMPGKNCPISKSLGDNDPNIERFRDFRDVTLAQSAIGRRIIDIYYNNADSVNAALERSPALRALTRQVLEVIAPMVGRKE